MTPTSADPTNAATGGGAASERAARRRRALLLCVAFGVWAWSTIAHGYGTDLAHDFFQWSKVPGHLDERGGEHGVRAADFLLRVLFVVLVCVGAVVAIRRFRALTREERRAHLLTWALWAACVHLLWKSCIVFASELIHFGQYAIVGALLYAGLGRGGRAAAAFLVAVFLGVLDEAWQHWGISIWTEGLRWTGLDWSDMILDAAGAAGGVLLLTTRPGEDRSKEPARLLGRAVVAIAALLLPLLLLSRATLATLFGTYTYRHAWNEYDIGKAAHWMTPVDGIPLFIASVLIFGLLVSGARTYVTRGAALGLVLLVTVSIDPPSRREGRAVHEDVPTAVARRAAADRIVVDGVIDEPEWAAAQRIGPFVRNEPEYPKHPRPADEKVPLAGTWARLIWDDRALYIAFEAQDRDVWARTAARDDPRLPGDEVVEIFVDPDGDEITYYEFEFSPLGVAYDLFNYIPESPSDFEPWAQFVGLADWDARDVECKVAVDGTLDAVADWESAGPLDDDRGLTMEIAIPWRAFRSTTTPSERTRIQLPPTPGQRWRVGLYRIERPRAAPGDGKPLSRNDADRFAQHQAWSPTFRASFHVPARFGIVEFE